MEVQTFKKLVFQRLFRLAKNALIDNDLNGSLLSGFFDEFFGRNFSKIEV
jgi:hypothetical protein